jgi:N-glycosylase/DNA lyase
LFPKARKIFTSTFAFALQRAIQETELRDLGFGYRAKYIVKAAEQVEEKGGDKWLQELRDGDREHVQCELTYLMGIGRKVADCVALFSLDKLDLGSYSSMD